MVILALPVFEIVTVCGADEVAVVMLPKLRLVGLMLSVRVAAIPVPLSVTEVGEVGALLTIEMFPVTAPTVVGRKATVIVVCCPTFTFRGSVNPLTLKAEPVSFTWVMVNVAVPVFVMIKDWVELLPTTPFPKLIGLELNWMPATKAGFTVSVAFALVTLPAVLLTTTSNVDPLSVVAVTGVV
jgi:hypothetical protein